MFKKTLLSLSCAVALGAVAAPAVAAAKFFLVVPLKAQTQAQEPVEAITVSLAGAALPKATVNKAYSESLRPYLSVTGDAAFDPAAASWSLAAGTLPAGLALDTATGAVAGTPTTKTTSPASFTVLASYKGSDGQAVYTIEVDGETLNVSKISTGYNHTCAITDAGGVKCWGGNGLGQLGNNSTTNSAVPVAVQGLSSGIASIETGLHHSCALTAQGAAMCWGSNDYGQVGNNTKINSLVPVNVAGITGKLVAITAGLRHTCAITGAGGVKCWGFNNAGQLGDGTKVNNLAPVDVIGLSEAVASISAGSTHTCAVTASGAAKCWGSNLTGQLGDNSTIARTAPVDVQTLGSGVASIQAGEGHTCAVTTGGVAKCWGYNSIGQLGTGNTTNSLVPVDVVGLSGGTAEIVAGQNHSCARTTAGAVKCWGQGNAGSLGNGALSNSSSPVDVGGLGGRATALVSGIMHNCAILESGALSCWGYNASGQLGNGKTANSAIPVSVQGFQ